MVGAVFIPASYYHFILTFIDKNRDKKKISLVYLAYIAAVIFAILNFTPLMILDVRPRLIFPFWPTAGPIYKYFLLYFAIYAIYGCYLLLREVKYANGVRRNQLFYIFVGSLIGYFGGATNFPLWYDIKIYPFGNILSSIYVGLIGYAIIHYRLMDITILAARTLIFIIVYGILLVVPLFTFFSSRAILLQILSSPNWWILPISVAFYATLASIAPFIFMYLRRRAENVLLKDQRHYQRALIQMSTTVTLIKELERLLKLIVIRVTRAVRVNFACIYLADQKNNARLVQKFPYTTFGFFPNFPKEIPYASSLVSYLKQHRQPIFSEELPIEFKKVLDFKSGIVIPTFVRQDILGFLVLGPKSSGVIYTEEDMSVFRILANQIGLAIENTQYLKELDELHKKITETEKLKGIAQMMYSLNHELRNIFNKMSVPAQMIEMGEFDNNKEAFSDALKTISNNIELGTEILTYVQSYSAKSKSNEVKPKRIDEIMRSTTAHFEKRFKANNIVVTERIEPNIPPVQARDTFDDLFKNILANCFFALTDQPREHKLIDIQLALSDDKSTINIKVSDTGPDMTKITSYTHETDSPFKERGKLGGVNLFLAYIIANDHNSKLTFESYEKGGTSFLLDLPIHQPAIAEGVPG